MIILKVLIVFVKIILIYGASNDSSKIYFNNFNSILSNVERGELMTLGEEYKFISFCDINCRNYSEF